MGEVRLNGLAHMHIQYSQPVDAYVESGREPCTSLPQRRRCDGLALKLHCLIVALNGRSVSLKYACAFIISVVLSFFLNLNSCMHACKTIVACCELYNL